MKKVTIYRLLQGWIDVFYGFILATIVWKSNALDKSILLIVASMLLCAFLSVLNKVYFSEENS